MSKQNLIGQYRSARDALNASLDLLRWSIDLREWLEWGILDVDDARAAVAELKRACEQHKARRRRMAA
jgi:hypothetical protein